MKGFPLVLIGIGGLGTIGTTTYSIVSETNKRTKRNLVSKEKLEEDLGKDVEGAFQKIKQKMIIFSNENPTVDKFDDPGKPELTLKILQEFCLELLTGNNSSLSKNKLINLMDTNKKDTIEEAYLKIKDFIEKIKGIDGEKDTLKNKYKVKFDFSLTDK